MREGESTTAYLVIRLDDEPERAIVWDTLDIEVGRLPEQDVVVEDAEVSRRHAVFHRSREGFSVEDLGTKLGTLVNGEPVAKHDLQHGDVIQIGKVTLRFGLTTQRVRPGANVCFASELKKGQLPSPAPSAGGRTMLGFDPGDSLLFAPPTTPGAAPVARAVTADGSLEDLDEVDPLGLSIDGTGLGFAAPPRDLDRELQMDPGDGPTPVPPPLQPRGDAASTSPRAERPAGLGNDLTTELRLVIAGPVAEVAMLVSAIRDRSIRFGSLELVIRER